MLMLLCFSQKCEKVTLAKYIHYKHKNMVSQGWLQLDPAAHILSIMWLLQIYMIIGLATHASNSIYILITFQGKQKKCIALT